MRHFFATYLTFGSSIALAINVLPVRISSNHSTISAPSSAALNLSTKPRIPNDTVSSIAGQVELDHLLIGALAILALYCFVALRRGRRTNIEHLGRVNSGSNLSVVGSTRGCSKKARGATRAQIESHLAHTTVTLYQANRSAMKESSIDAAHNVQFDQQQCAICLDLLAREDEQSSSVRILKCAHAFHAGMYSTPLPLLSISSLLLTTPYRSIY